MTLADCTVLVVEDHEFQRRTMLQILANLGTGRLLEAADGESALLLLAGGATRADIVVCDLDMPGMDGMEFLRHVAERRAAPAIVIASGLGEGVLRASETTARAYGLQVLGAVAKPLTARRLLEVVGLHRPAAPVLGETLAGRADRWAFALRAGAVRVELRPRIELLHGRPAGVIARACLAGDDADAATDLPADAPARVAAGIADLVLDAACSALDALDATAPAIDATLLLPSAAFGDLELADRFAVAVAQAGIDPGRLCVAVPWSPAAPGSAERLDVSTRLLMRGFGLGVDGFTAGDATPGAPAGLPLTEVVLARDAVTGASSSIWRAEALEATIATLREQGARVVAAGCDTEQQRELLVQAGCDRAEGRIAGAPMSAAALARWAYTAR